MSFLDELKDIKQTAEEAEQQQRLADGEKYREYRLKLEKICRDYAEAHLDGIKEEMKAAAGRKETQISIWRWPDNVGPKDVKTDGKDEAYSLFVNNLKESLGKEFKYEVLGGFREADKVFSETDAHQPKLYISWK